MKTPLTGFFKVKRQENNEGSRRDQFGQYMEPWSSLTSWFSSAGHTGLKLTELDVSVTSCLCHRKFADQWDPSADLSFRTAHMVVAAPPGGAAGSLGALLSVAENSSQLWKSDTAAGCRNERLSHQHFSAFRRLKGISHPHIPIWEADRRSCC